MFQITTLYRCIYANFTMILLLLASQKLATFTSSYTATITSQICKDLFVCWYVCHCHVCKQNKDFQFKKQGVLQPLPVPKQRWQDISIDFVTDIPKVQSYDAILNMSYRLSKKYHYIGTTKKLNFSLANLFLKHVWKHHSLLQNIVSDCRL